jgi:hypothetical protein
MFGFELGGVPHSKEFDPLKDDDWTIWMAVAWIVTLDPKKVTSLCDRFHTKSWKLAETVVGDASVPTMGWAPCYNDTLTSENAEKIVEQMESDWLRNPPLIDVRTANARLRAALIDGSLEAKGKGIDGAVGAIPRESWRHLTWISDSGANPADSIVDDSASDCGDEIRYEEVRLRRVEVMSKWPDHDGLEEKEVSRRHSALSRILQSYKKASQRRTASLTDSPSALKLQDELTEKLVREAVRILKTCAKENGRPLNKRDAVQALRTDGAVSRDEAREIIEIGRDRFEVGGVLYSGETRGRKPSATARK